MRLRSLLFVPADRPERMVKAMQSQADGIVLDLEDSVAPEQKVHARASLAMFLMSGQCTKPVFVRVNGLSSGWTEGDIGAFATCPPDGLLLPKAAGRASVEQLDKLLNAYGLDKLPILPIATETPAAVFEIGTYRDVASRLFALSWGVEDLSSAIGATMARESTGGFTPPYEVARALALFGAHAAGVQAIETVYPDFRDLEGLARAAKRAARDGFSGMLAIHPSQVSIINDAFAPSESELAHARAIVAAFAAHPGAGVLSLNGEMIDAPHAKLARRLLERAGIA
jgi:citrate lyase subunit beta/citryl-CoA lyase